MKIYEKPELMYIDFASEQITDTGNVSGGLDNGGND